MPVVDVGGVCVRSRLFVWIFVLAFTVSLQGFVMKFLISSSGSFLVSLLVFLVCWDEFGERCVVGEVDRSACSDMLLLVLFVDLLVVGSCVFVYCVCVC